MHNSSNATITKSIYGATVIESIYGLACAHAHTHILYTMVCVFVCVGQKALNNYPPSSYRVKMNIKTMPLFDNIKDSSEKENELFDN